MTQGEYPLINPPSASVSQIHFNAAVEPGSYKSPQCRDRSLRERFIRLYIKNGRPSKNYKFGRGARIYNLFLKLVARNFWFGSFPFMDIEHEEPW